MVQIKRLSFYLLCCSMIVVAYSKTSAAMSTKEAEKAGAILYRDKGCAYCHGTTGQGTHKGPSLENLRKKLKPEQIADQIKNGGQKMPSFQESVTEEELAQLVRYLRAKHKPVAPAAEAEPAVKPALSNPAQ